MKNLTVCLLTLCCAFGSFVPLVAAEHQNGTLVDANIDCSKEYPACGDCVTYCPMVKYRKQEYCVPKCVYEPCQTYKTCCRYKPEYYEVTRCRYVPEYYKTTHCRQVPEYYQECNTTYKPRYEYEKHCRYIPCTYYKKTCTPNQCSPQPTNCCAPKAPCANGMCR